MIIQTWIASTTHLDRQNQKMSKEALEWMAEQINFKFIPQLIEHDFENQIWVLLYWEVFLLPDWEFWLWVVIWIFQNIEDKNIFKNYENNNVSNIYKKYFNVDEFVKLFLENKNREDNIQIEKDTDNDELNFANLLEKHLNSTSVTPSGDIYIIKRFVASTNWLKIEVYPKDHFPPHFHVVSKERDLNARFDLDSFDYISTKNWKITDKQKRQIKNFLETNPKIVEKLKNTYIRLQW